MTRSIAIMQPTFLPWLGYFALMDRVDEFVFLDSVQFAHRSWQQRNKIKTPQGVQWMTVPVRVNGRRTQLIHEVTIDGGADFSTRAMSSLRANYARAPYFAWCQALLGPLRDAPELLAELTIALIMSIRDGLGITTSCIRSSEISASGSRADLLVSICRTREASVYVSPVGSRAYLDGSTVFSDAGIELVYNEYSHPEYPQLWGPFEPYLSAIDLLFNVGPEALPVIRRGLE